MDELERALRETLSDDRLDLPVRPGAVGAVHDGVRRRRRRRAIATAGSVLATATAVVAAVVVAAGLTPDARPAPALHPPSYDVAWRAIDPPPPWSPPTRAPRVPTLDARPCTADQLRVGRPLDNGATGHEFTSIPLRNVSDRPCKLIGRPVRVVAQEPGQPDVTATNGLDLSGGGVGGDVAPGHRGYLTVETERDCAARYADPEGGFPTRTYHRLVVTLPSNTSFTLTHAFDVECGLRTGGLGVFVRQPAPVRDPRQDLTVRLDVPRTVPVGRAPVYVVALTNPTSRTVPLHRVSYLEYGDAPDGSPYKEMYGLDCSRIRSLAPHQTVRYEMRLATPVTSQPGTLTLHWSLDAVPAAVGDATIEVVGASPSPS